MVFAKKHDNQQGPGLGPWAQGPMDRDGWDGRAAGRADRWQAGGTDGGRARRAGSRAEEMGGREGRADRGQD